MVGLSSLIFSLSPCSSVMYSVVLVDHWWWWRRCLSSALWCLLWGSTPPLMTPLSGLFQEWWSTLFSIFRSTQAKSPQGQRATVEEEEGVMKGRRGQRWSPEEGAVEGQRIDVIDWFFSLQGHCRKEQTSAVGHEVALQPITRLHTGNCSHKLTPAERLDLMRMFLVVGGSWREQMLT